MSTVILTSVWPLLQLSADKQVEPLDLDAPLDSSHPPKIPSWIQVSHKDKEAAADQSPSGTPSGSPSGPGAGHKRLDSWSGAASWVGSLLRSDSDSSLASLSSEPFREGSPQASPRASPRANDFEEMSSLAGPISQAPVEFTPSNEVADELTSAALTQPAGRPKGVRTPTHGTIRNGESPKSLAGSEATGVPSWIPPPAGMPSASRRALESRERLNGWLSCRQLVVEMCAQVVVMSELDRYMRQRKQRTIAAIKIQVPKLLRRSFRPPFAIMHAALRAPGGLLSAKR